MAERTATTLYSSSDLAMRKHREVNTTKFSINPDRIGINSNNNPPDKRPISGYDPLFDIERRALLNKQKDQLTKEDYTRRKDQLDSLITLNLETMLGERFKVEISQITYSIENGLLVSPLHDEPFIDVIMRGQKYRALKGSKETARETAEVKSFRKVQKLLLEDTSQVGQEVPSRTSEVKPEKSRKIIVISPRGKNGSLYQHNFFDVYEKTGTEVKMTRYATGASLEQFRQAAEELDPFNDLPNDPTDADFINNPLITYKNIGEILDSFPQEEDIITLKEFEKIKRFVAQIIINYVNNPSKKTYNALLNLADHIALGPDPKTAYYSRSYAIAEIINRFGNLPSRQVAAGCGPQGMSVVSSQLSVVSFSPYSVSEFAPFASLETTDTSDFPCPRCGYIITYGAGIKECPGCNLSATCT